MREGAAAIIGRQPDMVVVGEAADDRECVDRWLQCRPDVTLLDLHRPILDGIAAIEAIRRAASSAPLIVLTTFGADHLPMILRTFTPKSVMDLPEHCQLIAAE